MSNTFDPSRDSLFHVFDLSNLLTRTAALVKKAFLPAAAILFGYDLFLFVSSRVVMEWMPNLRFMPGRQYLTGAGWLFLLFLSYFVTVATYLVAFRTIRCEPLPTTGEVLRLGLNRLPWAAINCFLAFVLIMIGTTLLVVPGLVIATALSVLVPVLFLEDSEYDGLNRSAELTRGHRWTLFFFLLVTGVCCGFVVLCCGLVGALAHLTSLVPYGFGRVLAGNLTFIIGACSVVMAYHDLRLVAQEFDEPSLEEAVGTV